MDVEPTDDVLTSRVVYVFNLVNCEYSGTEKDATVTAYRSDGTYSLPGTVSHPLRGRRIPLLWPVG